MFESNEIATEAAIMTISSQTTKVVGPYQGPLDPTSNNLAGVLDQRKGWSSSSHPGYIIQSQAEIGQEVALADERIPVNSVMMMIPAKLEQ